MKENYRYQKIILLLLTIVFLTGLFQIFGYFFFIYRPASAIFGGDRAYRLEIPAISQILKPPQITDQSVNLDDTTKKFNEDSYKNVRDYLDRKLETDNTFVKNATLSIIVAGSVDSIQKQSDDSIELVLTNTTGEKVTEKFSKKDVESTPISLIIISPSNPSHDSARLEEIMPGDYIIIKTSSNVLNNSLLLKQIEIFRTQLN